MTFTVLAIPSITALVVGVVIGTLIIRRFKFEPRHIALMSLLGSAIAAAAYFIAIGLACDRTEIYGLVDPNDPMTLSVPHLTP